MYTHTHTFGYVIKISVFKASSSLLIPISVDEEYIIYLMEARISGNDFPWAKLEDTGQYGQSAVFLCAL